MISYKSAKQLKDAGFPQKTKMVYALPPKTDEKYRNDYSVRFPEGYTNLLSAGYDVVSIPTLLELIEECGNEFDELINLKDKFMAYGGGLDIVKGIEQWNSFGEGKTPEEAVKNLWLKLNN